jgi:hypothetical protein
MSKSARYDVRKAKVVLVYDFDGWSYHAFVEYEGMIFDATDGTGPFQLVPGQPSTEYFAKHRYGPTSHYKVVPGQEYLEKGQLTPWYYLHGIGVEGKTLDHFVEGLPKGSPQ